MPCRPVLCTLMCHERASIVQRNVMQARINEGAASLNHHEMSQRTVTRVKLKQAARALRAVQKVRERVDTPMNPVAMAAQSTLRTKLPVALRTCPHNGLGQIRGLGMVTGAWLLGAGMPGGRGRTAGLQGLT